MKKKYVFPEKWQIRLTKENFDIVKLYYSVVSTCYTDPSNIGSWIKSHNHEGDTPSHYSKASFFYKEDGFTDITTEEFQKYVLNKECKIEELEDVSYLIPLIKNLDNGN